MNGLKLGDTVLDPKGFVYLPQINALVCSGLLVALQSKDKKRAREVAADFTKAIQAHCPETIIHLGEISKTTAFTSLRKKWGAKLRWVLVAKSTDKAVQEHAESLKFEVHQELLWNKYRFIEKFESPPFLDPQDMQALDFQFLTIAGEAPYYVKIGYASYDPLGIFSGEKLGVFLKGLGRLELPSLNPTLTKAPLLSLGHLPFFNRFDVFAIGHSRLLPLGKISDIQKFVSRNGLPVKKKVFVAQRQKSSRPTKDFDNGLLN